MICDPTIHLGSLVLASSHTNLVQAPIPSLSLLLMGELMLGKRLLGPNRGPDNTRRLKQGERGRLDATGGGGSIWFSGGHLGLGLSCPSGLYLSGPMIFGINYLSPRKIILTEGTP